MAKERTKSINDLAAQEFRIRERNEALADAKKISREEFRNRAQRVMGITEKYAKNIQNSPSYKKAYEAMLTQARGKPVRVQDALYERTLEKQYSRSTYMGGVKRASGSKG